jgi:hypothetical protein
MSHPGGSVDVVVLDPVVTVLVVGTAVVVVPLGQTAALCRKDSHDSVPNATIEPSPQRMRGTGPKAGALVYVVPVSIGVPS